MGKANAGVDQIAVFVARLVTQSSTSNCNSRGVVCFQSLQSENIVRNTSFVLARHAQAFGGIALNQAHASIGRVVMLRGYGNAIVPQVAAVFIESFNEALTEEKINEQ